MVRNLSEVLEPCSLKEFFAVNWGKSFRYVQGRHGKFSDLLPWDRLNEILCRNQLDFPRLHLAQSNKTIPPEIFLKYAQSRRDIRVFLPRLQPPALTEQLRQGATLVIDDMQEVYEPIMELASQLERTFHERIRVNAYLGCHTSNAFDVHWDDHEVLILQIAGRKRWKVYGSTRPYPINEDKSSNTIPPQTPLWEGMLDDGDILYMPRGWWHYATPIGEPSLHLNFSIYNSTGIDLLTWITKQLGASETFRMDLPRFASKSEQDTYVTKLRDELHAALDSDVLEGFFRYCDGIAEHHPYMNLPWSLVAEPLPSSDDTQVCLTTSRALKMDIEAGQNKVIFFANGKRWRLSAKAAVVLQPLANGQVCSIRELCEVAAGKLSRQTVRKLLNQMIVQGLIALAGVSEESMADLRQQLDSGTPLIADTIRPEILDALVKSGAADSKHSSRSLLQHLRGTYALLERWGNPSDICLGGLFHSIYGTQYYTNRSVELSRRDTIRELIGEKAEELAYLFCACDREDLLRNCNESDSVPLTDLFEGKEVRISESAFRALIEISVANLLEQLPFLVHSSGKKNMRASFEKWKAVEPFLSAKAFQHFCEYFKSLT